MSAGHLCSSSLHHGDNGGAKVTQSYVDEPQKHTFEQNTHTRKIKNMHGMNQFKTFKGAQT